MIHTEIFPLPRINCREVLRYAGVKEASPELTALLEDTMKEAAPVLTGRVCWREFSLSRDGNMLDLGFAKTTSTALDRNLAGCDRIVVFAATLGLSLDRLIARYGQIAPSKALLLQAFGAERIEALCDAFCEKIRMEAAEHGLRAAPRFSPGYGDLPLEIQQDLFRVLDCSRRIGLTLNNSFLMSPSKSVTAVIGLGPCANPHHPSGCKNCSKTDCLYRRTP